MDLIFSGSFLCSGMLFEGKKILELVNSRFLHNYVPREHNSYIDSLVKCGISRWYFVSYWAEEWALDLG